MTPPRDVGHLIGMTVALSWLDGEQATDELAAIGFGAIEVHLRQIGPALVGPSVLEAHAAAMGALIEGRSLVPSSLNAAGEPGFEPIAGDWEGSVGVLAHQLRLAAALGAPRLICWDGRLGESQATRAPIRLAEAIEAARDRSGLQDPPAVSVEFHPFTFALAAGQLLETAHALDEIGAGICLDFCHFGVALGPGFATSLGTDVLAATNHVHLADSDCCTSELHAPLGAGVLAVDEIAGMFGGRPVALAWDLFGWPAARQAMRDGLPRYREIMSVHRSSLGMAS